MTQYNFKVEFPSYKINLTPEDKLEEVVVSEIKNQIAEQVANFIDKNESIEIHHKENGNMELTASLVLGNEQEFVELAECITRQRDILIQNFSEWIEVEEDIEKIEEVFSDVIECVIKMIDKEE